MPMQVGPQDIVLAQIWDSPLQNRQLEDRAYNLMKHFITLAELAGDNDWHPLRLDSFIVQFEASYDAGWLEKHLNEVFVARGFLKRDEEGGFLPTLKLLAMFEIKSGIEADPSDSMQHPPG